MDDIEHPAPQRASAGPRIETLAARGVDTRSRGPVNVPVQRASTILYDDVDAYANRHAGFYDRVTYGLYGTDTAFALAADVAALEGGYRTVVTSSGTSAIALSLSAVVSAGEHLLVADTVYGSTRKFCEDVLRRFGVDAEYFDPVSIDDLAGRFRPNTRAVFLEAPGSHTFEMIDIPAAAELARSREVVTLMDNTWATPVFFRPLEAGVDISIHSATKYFSGHSDVMLGTVTTSDAALYARIKDTVGRYGCNASPDDCYLVHRGLRTLDVRLRRHWSTADRLIEWLRRRPEVVRILYPGLADDPGHALWRRDFQGASGLFGVVLRPEYADRRHALFDALRLFKLGSSWGGFESLMVPAAPAPVRDCRPAPDDGYLVRIHAGLEHPDDLIADLERAFATANGHAGPNA
jgi:cystathionine beta-lyase